METDALLVMALSVLAWQYGKAGAWVLLCGLLRYLFVAGGWLWPWLRRPLPPSIRRQTICVVQVVGHFHKGDVVALCDADGSEVARGLTNYSAEDVRKICGLRTEQVPEVLGSLPYEEVVHRDNLVVIV